MSGPPPTKEPMARDLLGQAAKARQAGNRAAAAELIRQAMARAAVTKEPMPKALPFDLAVILYELAQYAEAEARLEAALKLEPQNIGAINNLANVHLMSGNGAKARAATEKLAKREPRNGEYQRMHGAALRLAGDIPGALAGFRRARELEPGNIRAWMNEAQLLEEGGRAGEAVALLASAPRTLADQRPFAEARVTLLRRLGRLEDAQAVLADLRARYPDEAWIAAEQARTVNATDRASANALLREALEKDPTDTRALMDLIDSLDRTRGPEEQPSIAEAYLLAKRRLALGGDLLRDSRTLRNVLHRSGDYAAANSLGGFEELGEYWTRIGQVSALHYHMAQVTRPEHRRMLVEWHRHWGRAADALAARAPLALPQLRTQRAKLRVGLMSSDLRNHPVTYFALPLIELYDRNRFELFCYSFYEGEEDAIQKHIRGKVDEFRLAPGIPDREAAQLIAGDQLDMLFELGGSTWMNKLRVMTWRPAKLQASWLGYPHSAGLETIDHILVDPYILPADPALLIEKPFLMNRSWVVLGRLGFDTRLEILPTLPEERQGRITFGTANNPNKYTEPTLRLWASIMREVEGSHFLFIRPEGGTEAFRENLRALFAAEGIAPGRIEFEAVRATHMPHYNRIDIALDTFPQTGGTTTCEALWMGVPTVTLVGEAFFERLSHSNLSNAGLPGLSCFSPAAYRRTALELAKDKPRRAWWRRTLRQLIRDNPLGRQDWWVEDFQDAVVQAVNAPR